MTNYQVCILIVLVLFAGSGNAAEYVLGVDGLACPFCTYGIEKRLRTLEGVKKVEVDIEKGHVYVFTLEPVQLSEDQVRAKVSEAGFTLRSFAPSKNDEAGHTP